MSGSRDISLTQKQVQGYQDNGYLVVPKMFEKTEVDRITAGERVTQYQEITVTMNEGDALLIDMNLFHGITEDDYVPFGLRYEFNDFMMARVTGGET